MKQGRIIGVVCLAVATAGLLPTAAAADDVYVVTRTDDTPTCVPLVDCSLRGAIALANSDADHDIVAIQPGDHTLALGQLSIAEPLTLVSTGTPRNSSVRGGGSRVFSVSDDTVMAGFAVRDGAGRDDPGLLSADNARGGGIRHLGGSLLLANVRIAGNTVDNAAGALGGGIFHAKEAGPLLLAAVLIDGNAAKAGTAAGQLASGGGVFAEGPGGGAVSVVSATVASNTVSGAAGTQGGGIAAAAGSTVALVNATVAGNSATGAGTLGGNLAPAGTVSALNTIFSGGSAPAGGNCSGVVSSQGYNLEPGTSCGLGAAGDRNADPALGPLADNGGPTDTMAIAATSPAFDAGSDAGCPAIDQRNVSRLHGRACDVGAFELAAPRPAPASGGGPAPTGSADVRPPVLARLSLAPRAFRVAPASASARARRVRAGATVRHTLSERATVAYLVERARGGRRRGAACVSRTRANRRARTCTIWRALPGAFARDGAPGANRFRFGGRLGGKRLAPGRYRMLAVARDGAGNVSPIVRGVFRIVR